MYSTGLFVCVNSLVCVCIRILVNVYGSLFACLFKCCLCMCRLCKCGGNDYISLLIGFCMAHTYTHTHTHTHTHAHTHTQTHTHTHTHTHTYCLAHSVLLTSSYTHSLLLTSSYTHSLSCVRALYRTLTFSLSLT